MAVKKNETVAKKIKPAQSQKIIVEQGRSMGTPYVPYKVLYTERVPNIEEAKKRVTELKEEYKNVDALSVHYFSV